MARGGFGVGSTPLAGVVTRLHIQEQVGHTKSEVGDLPRPNLGRAWRMSRACRRQCRLPPCPHPPRPPPSPAGSRPPRRARPRSSPPRWPGPPRSSPPQWPGPHGPRPPPAPPLHHGAGHAYPRPGDEDINYNTSTSRPAAPFPAPPDAPPPQAPPSSSSGPITQARARDLIFIMLLKNEGPEE